MIAGSYLKLLFAFSQIVHLMKCWGQKANDVSLKTTDAQRINSVVPFSSVKRFSVFQLIVLS